MKNLLTLCISFLFLGNGCNSDQENIISQEKGELMLGFDLIQKNKSSRIANTIPSGSAIRLSIQNSEGVPIFTNKVISILKINENWISEPLPIPTGSYILTELLILSPNNEILYAVPLQDSPVADLVLTPLPVSFVVNPNEIINLNIELLHANDLNPADIGYVTFPFKTVDYFFLSVFTPSHNGHSFADAQAFIIQNSDTINSFNIQPEPNTLTFTSADSGVFTLVIIKSGFSKYSQNFTISEIYEDYENALISVQLKPAFTFVADPNLIDGINIFDISIGFNGIIKIDWGDGQIQHYSANEDDLKITCAHIYEKEGLYFVSVTKDIQNIRTFYSYYGAGPIKEINLTNLSNLIDFRLGLSGESSHPKVFDFSNNLQVQHIDVGGNSNLEDIILSENNEVKDLSLFGPNQIKTEDLEEIISKVYGSAIENNRHRGNISLSTRDNDGTFIGPPSNTTLEHLRILKQNYNWYLEPDLEFLIKRSRY